jgi:hypothetical protein
MQNQSAEQVLLNHNRSTRPVRARHPTRLDTDLVVTATPKGHTVHLRSVPTPDLRLSQYQVPTEDCQALAYGLKTLLPSTHIVHLICSWVPRSETMFQICTFWTKLDHHLAMSSTWSVSRSIMKARFIHYPRMVTPALDLHALSTSRLNTSKTMNMIWIHYRTLRVSL